MAMPPFTAAALQDRLDELLDPVLSMRRNATALAHTLAQCTRAEQDFALHWVEVIAKTNPEMAYQFASAVPDGFKRMSAPTIEAWIIEAMDIYDKLGMYPAIAVLKDAPSFAARAAEQARGIAFEEVAGMLELFVRGLSGRALKVAAADEVYTDTSTIFLPRRVSLFADRKTNRKLYKAIAAHLWAQTRFGTFRLNLAQRSREFAAPAKAIRLFHALETIRLDAQIARDLSGLHRDLCELRGAVDYPAAWAPHLARLRAADADVQDTFDVLRAVYADTVPTALCYQGALFPERVEQATTLRQAQEKDAFRTALARMLGDDNRDKDFDPLNTAEASGRFTVDKAPDPNRPEGFIYQLKLDGQPIAPPGDMKGLMDSIVQDLGDIPNDYLVAAGDGEYRKREELKSDDVAKGTSNEAGAFIYNEWDYRRQHYRKDWCVLREIDVQPVDEPFVARTLRKYAGLAATLRKTFEALRGENKIIKRQKHGDEIDFEAMVEGYVDLHCGRELGERLFMKTHKHERNIAVMFMVDMSGSTKGWINDAEREALVLLCEALQVLGDRYAIYGFSGITRKRCELYRVKRFDEAYSPLVKRRITGIKPQDYTRMGVTIRHLSKLLNDVDARTKLLITLSDGKPDDYDGYRGDYGIEDTRQALIEARRGGIHPFCITIDSEARDYLPHMYGAANYTLIDDVRKLPQKVSDIYRRLTS